MNLRFCRDRLLRWFVRRYVITFYMYFDCLFEIYLLYGYDYALHRLRKKQDAQWKPACRHSVIAFK